MWLGISSCLYVDGVEYLLLYRFAAMSARKDQVVRFYNCSLFSWKSGLITSGYLYV